MTLSRRRFLARCAAAASVLPVWQTGTRRSDASTGQAIDWHDVTKWPNEGRGWEDEPRKRFFDRLPAKAEGVVRGPVWNLSRHSAGIAVRFRSNASTIYADYELYSKSLALPHMPATGVSGLDLYASTEGKIPRWVQVIKPTAQHVVSPLAKGLVPVERDYTVYLPLYNGVDSLKIGVPAGALIEPLAPRAGKPLVFYGTSIMHGACASRPGMALPAILGRRFDRPTINLGFSGNGRMDPEMGDLLADLDPIAYCIDCLPNMQPQAVAERTVPLVRRLRQSRPETPILLVEGRFFTNAEFFQGKLDFHRKNHQALRDSFRGLVASGVKDLYYLAADDLLGHDGEAATDGSHPSDLGFLRYADAYEKALRPALADL